MDGSCAHHLVSDGKRSEDDPAPAVGHRRPVPTFRMMTLLQDRSPNGGFRSTAPMNGRFRQLHAMAAGGRRFNRIAGTRNRTLKALRVFVACLQQPAER